MPQYKQLPTRSPEQMQTLNQILSLLGGQGGAGLQQALQHYMNILSGSPEAFAAYEAPIKRQFEEEVVPGIAERFGALGARSSSGFQQTLARAGERLSETLGAQRAGLQGQAAQGLLGAFQGLAGTGLGVTPFGYVEKQSPFEQFLGPFGGGLGQGLSQMAGDPETWKALAKYLPMLLSFI